MSRVPLEGDKSEESSSGDSHSDESDDDEDDKTMLAQTDQAMDRRVSGTYDIILDHDVVLLVTGQPHWHEVKSFLVAFQTGWDPQPKLLILANEEAPPDIACYMGKHVGIQVGPVLNITFLISKKVHLARAVVCVSGKGIADDDSTVMDESTLNDSGMLIVTTMLQKLSRSAQKMGHQVVLFEFGNTQFVRLAEREAQHLSIKASHESYTRPLEEDNGVLARIRDVASVVFNANVEFNPIEAALADRAFLDRRLAYHPSFAAGKVLSPDIFGKFMGHMFIFPATIELGEAMLTPELTKQSAFPGHVVCPEQWVGKTFGDVVCGWLNGPIITCGPNAFGTSDKDNKGRVCGPVLAMAIYREKENDNAFNWTLPDQSEQMLKGDGITVLASKAFMELAERAGILWTALTVDT